MSVIVTNVADLQALARKRVPRVFYEYVDSGSWTESTYRANEDRLGEIRLRQRVAVNLEHRSTVTSILGQAAAMPVAIAPTGLSGMQRANGEVLAARAARRFGIPFTLSTMSICSIEDVAEAVGPGTFWFQLYIMRDREFVSRLIQRAKLARCPVLVLTLDLPVIGQRHKDLRNGLGAPPKLTVSNILNILSKPSWCMDMARARRFNFGNIVGHAPGVTDMGTLADWTARQFDPSVTWDDVLWVRRQWPGKLVLKGIQDVADAQSAARAGADAIIVSNHGGRQLDGALSSVEALPAIVDAVADRLEVHMDGGVRSGQDVLKVLALGAKAAYIGRAHLYGLGALGEDGVTAALEIIRKELDHTMAFCGVTNALRIDRQVLA